MSDNPFDDVTGGATALANPFDEVTLPSLEDAASNLESGDIYGDSLSAKPIRADVSQMSAPKAIAAQMGQGLVDSGQGVVNATSNILNAPAKWITGKPMFNAPQLPGSGGPRVFDTSGGVRSLAGNVAETAGEFAPAAVPLGGGIGLGGKLLTRFAPKVAQTLLGRAAASGVGGAVGGAFASPEGQTVPGAVKNALTAALFTPAAAAGESVAAALPETVSPFVRSVAQRGTSAVAGAAGTVAAGVATGENPFDAVTEAPMGFLAALDAGKAGKAGKAPKAAENPFDAVTTAKPDVSPSERSGTFDPSLNEAPTQKLQAVQPSTEQQLPSAAVAPDWLREKIDQDNAHAERLGLADKIEELSAQGLVAKEVASKLGAIPGMDQMDVGGMVRAVRLKRGIPSQMDPAEFNTWRDAYNAKNGAPVPEALSEPAQTAAPAEEPVQPPQESVPSAAPAQLTRDAFDQQMRDAFKLPEDEHQATMALIDARASARGQTPDQYVGERFANVTNPDTLDPVDKLKSFFGPGVTRQASVEFADDGRAVLNALKNPDVSTPAHEFAHVWRRELAPEDLKIASDWVGAKDGDWQTVHEEKFARGFERWLREGVAPTAKLIPVFQKFKQWLGAIYQKIAGSSIAGKLTPQARELFQRMLTPDGTPVEASATANPFDAVTEPPSATPEAPPASPSAPGTPPGDKYAGSVNVARVSEDPAVQATVRSDYAANQASIDAARGPSRTLAGVREETKGLPDFTNDELRDVVTGDRKLGDSELDALHMQATRTWEAIEANPDTADMEAHRLAVEAYNVAARRAGQNLGILRNRGTTLKAGVIQNIERLFQAAGRRVPDSTYKKIAGLPAGTDVTEYNRVLHEEARKVAGPLYYLNPYFVSNLLANPSTAVTVTAAQLSNAMAAKPLALLAQGRRVGAYYEGALGWSTLKTAGARALAALQTGYSTADLADLAKDPKNYEPRLQLPGNLKQPLNVLPRTHLMASEIFKAASYYGHLNMEATEAAATAVKGSGLKGAAYKKALADHLANSMLDPDIIKRADEFAKSVSYQEDLPQIIQSASDAINKLDLSRSVLGDAAGKNIKPLRFLFPFMKIAYNVSKQYLDFTPLGLGRKLLNRSAPTGDVLAKSLIGTGIVGYIGFLADQGRVTAAAPTDPADREAFYGEGKKPFSIKVTIPGVGDRYIPDKYFGPLAGPLIMGAYLREAMNPGQGKEPEGLVQAGTHTAAGLASAIQEESMLFGLSLLMDATTNPAKAQRLLASIASGFIPASAGLRWATKQIDPYARETGPNYVPPSATGIEPAMSRATSGIGNQLIAGIPGASEALPPRLGAFGNPVPRDNNYDDPVYETLDRLGLMPTTPAKSFAFGNQRVALAQSEIDEITKAGSPGYAAVLQASLSPQFQAMSLENQQAAIKELLKTQMTEPRGEVRKVVEGRYKGGVGLNSLPQ